MGRRMHRQATSTRVLDVWKQGRLPLITAPDRRDIFSGEEARDQEDQSLIGKERVTMTRKLTARQKDLYQLGYTAGHVDGWKDGAKDAKEKYEASFEQRRQEVRLRLMEQLASVAESCTKALMSDHKEL